MTNCTCIDCMYGGNVGNEHGGIAPPSKEKGDSEMSNYSAENVKAVANGEQVESVNIASLASSRDLVGNISLDRFGLSLNIYLEHFKASEEVSDRISSEAAKLLINHNYSAEEFAQNLSEVLNNSGILPRLVVEEAQ